MAIRIDISEGLTSYKNDLEKGLINLETEINSISISLSSISSGQINRIENLFTDSLNNLRHIEVELSILPKTTKEKWAIFMKTYNDKLSKLKKSYLELKATRNRSEKNDNENESTAQSKLLNVNKKVDDGTNLITQSIKTMTNVNNTDVETMASLKRQTEVIKGTTHKLNEAESFIDRTDHVIRNMIKRLFTNKLVLFALIILLGLINAFLIYIKIKYKLLVK